MLVSAAVDYAEHAVLVETFEAEHRRMKAETVCRLDGVALLDPQLRTRAVVRWIAIRHDRVQAVVATGQLDDHENTLGMPFDAGAFERLRRQGSGGAAQDHRERSANTDAIQSANEKFATRATAAGVCPGHI